MFLAPTEDEDALKLQIQAIGGVLYAMFMTTLYCCFAVFSNNIIILFISLTCYHSEMDSLLLSDTLGTLARTMGAEHFRPLTKDCIEMGLKLLATTQDPDLKRCM